MRGTARRFLLATLPMLGQAARSRAASDLYPTMPISLIVPFSAGGAADVSARLIARFAPRHLPVPGTVIQIENRAGASGAIGTQMVARARPDGQTLLLARVASSAILPATDPRTPYAWDEFTILGLLEETPFVICVRSDAPWDRLGELIAALREQPGSIVFATSGSATLLDLGVRQFFIGAGLPLDAGIARPFRGGGDAVKALLEGEAQFIGMNLTEALPMLRDGRLRGLAVGTPERLRLLPAVPTAREAEVPSLAAVTGWSALLAPPGLEDGPARAWRVALAALREDTGWQDAVRAAGAVPRLLSPEETQAYLRAQIALYRDIGRQLGLI